MKASRLETANQQERKFKYKICLNKFGRQEWCHAKPAPREGQGFLQPLSTKNPGTSEQHHLASFATHEHAPPRSCTAIIRLACSLNSEGTRRNRGKEQQPHSHAGGTHLNRREAVIGQT
jgi:hypothetical protein